MKTVIDPQTMARATAFKTWMKSPMPMVTLIKTLKIGRLLKLSRKSGLKLNMLICWCIGRAASDIEEFYLLPVGEQLIKYDHLAIDVIVKTKDGNICSCDIPWSENLQQFNEDYIRLTQQVHNTSVAHDLSDDYMIVGTSAMVECELDGIVNQYSGIYNNPFLAWGKYRKRFLKAVLPISLQFHHAQMDGAEACKFLNALQDICNY